MFAPAGWFPRAPGSRGPAMPRGRTWHRYKGARSSRSTRAGRSKKGPELPRPGLRSQTLAMVSRKAVAGLLVVYVVSMLAEQTDGFVPFFTQSDFRKMQLQEKERSKAGQKKSPPALQRREQEGFSERAAADVSEVRSIQLAVPVLGMWLAPRQLENHPGVLEELLAELSRDTPDAD